MLYGSINKMLEQGLIEESDERPDPHLDDERRRYYRITPFGRRVAQAEAVRVRNWFGWPTNQTGASRNLREVTHARPGEALSPTVAVYPARFREEFADAPGAAVPG